MGNKFTQKAQNALGRALNTARDMGHTYIGSEHILCGLSEERESIASKLLSAKGARPEKIRERIVELSGVGGKSQVTPYDMTPRAKKIIENSSRQAEGVGCAFIGTEHLLLSLLSEKECVGVRILESLGVRIYDLSVELSNIGSTVVDKSDTQKPSKKSEEDKLKIKGAPTLSLYGKDLTDHARRGRLDPTIGRDTETERVIQILSRRTKNNPCLIGEPGVGKTAVVEGLARRIADGGIPTLLCDKRIVTLDLSAMIAGSKYRGEFEERMKNVMEDVRKNPDIILFIDEIHTIIGAGAAEGAVDAANIIKPALARGELQVIGATTISEFRLRIEKDAALERRFQSVMINEPDDAEAIRILEGLREKYEEHHSLKINDSAIAAAVRLSKRYIPDRYLPDKAIDLIDEAASKVRISATLHSKERDKNDSSTLQAELRTVGKQKEDAVAAADFDLAAKLHERELSLRKMIDESEAEGSSDEATPPVSLEVSEGDVAAIVTEWTGIPVSSVGDLEDKKLLGLEEALSARIIGQPHAIESVAGAIRRGRMGFKNPSRPTGTFIFFGPTGVGKTELCKALAEELFGSESALIRFDMSEYMERHSISKLIGSPPGYVGYEDGGRLTEKVRRRPYSVVLFDEIEKAHPDVFNLLLGILDDGHVTDSAGRRVDFKNTVIIMTSNCSASRSSAVLGFSSADITEKKKSALAEIPEGLKRTFSDEFLARVDEILVFDRLGAEELCAIAKKMLRAVAARGREMGIELEFSPDVADFIASLAAHAHSGARPIRRAIIKNVEDKLSAAMLEGRIARGDKVICSVCDGEVQILLSELQKA